MPLGVVPEAAGSLLMPVVMGNQRAALALYTGDWITAEEAVACGLALRVVEPDAAASTETMDARPAHRGACRSPSLVETQAARARRPHRRGPRRPWPAKTRRSRAMVGAPANIEALTAFLEKREPDFRSL